MKVSIKSFAVDMEVKSNGIEFEVRSPDGSKFLGDCYLTMTGLVWCKGKTSKKNGQEISWDDFIARMSDSNELQSAINNAKKGKGAS